MTTCNVCKKLFEDENVGRYGSCLPCLDERHGQLHGQYGPLYHAVEAGRRLLGILAADASFTPEMCAELTLICERFDAAEAALQDELDAPTSGGGQPAPDSEVSDGN